VKLGKQLRSLSKLTLKVTALRPLSACIRHTSAFTPLPHPYAGGAASASGRVRRCMEPILVLVQLEGSGMLPPFMLSNHLLIESQVLAACRRCGLSSDLHVCCMAHTLYADTKSFRGATIIGLCGDCCVSMHLFGTGIISLSHVLDKLGWPNLCQSPGPFRCPHPLEPRFPVLEI